MKEKTIALLTNQLYYRWVCKIKSFDSDTEFSVLLLTDTVSDILESIELSPNDALRGVTRKILDVQTMVEVSNKNYSENIYRRRHVVTVLENLHDLRSIILCLCCASRPQCEAHNSYTHDSETYNSNTTTS